MTIEEIKARKQRLEKEIAEKIYEFEKETGLKMSDMDIEIEHIWTYDEPIDVEVKIEVKI